MSARDPERLALAVIALILMPWNAALWWCAARLRRAIELDCDARVLRRYPGAKQYGNLLLDVASRGQGFGPIGIPAMAFLRLPSELELRLRAMVRRRSVARRAIVVGAGIAVVAVAAAFTTPVPEFQVLQHDVRKPLSAAASQSAIALDRATIKVGGSLVTLASTVYAPKAHTTSAGTSAGSSGYLARADTDSTGIGSRGAAVLRRRADSLRVLSAQLAARTHELDAVKTRLDSTNVALSVAVAQSKARGMARSLVANQLNYGDNGRRVVVNQQKFLEIQRKLFAETEQKYVEQQRKFAKQAATFEEVRRTQLPAAIARYYPDLAASAKPGMLLWFVVDSSGRVIRTALDTSLNRSTYFSAELVAKRFPGIASRDITSTSVLGKVIGDAGVTVVWAVDGKP